MSGSLFLARQYLRRNPVITGVLTAALSLIILLPSVLVLVVDDASRHLLLRADSTPLVLGAKGSPLELVLGTLYFDEPTPQAIPMSQVDRLRKLDRGTVIPMHTGYRIRGGALVGTTDDYFALRKLSLARGRFSSIAGECVLGADVAERLALSEGDSLATSSARAFSLQEAPLQLNVVGVFKRTETSDDEGVFVDLKTIWILEGLGHGHLEGTAHGTEAGKQYTVITAQNLKNFHFHGHEDEFPVTAAVVKPEDSRARALLLGEYLSREETVQLVRPDEVMDSLLSTILTVRRYVVALVGAVSVITIAVMALVIALSVRLRRREIETMVKIGCARHTIAGILFAQVGIVILASAGVAGVFTWLAASCGDELIRWIVLR